MGSFKTKRILSLDGGGIYGIIPIIALIKLEKETGKLTRDIFSFAAGTSTGAIIASAVAAGIPATQILEDYITLSQKVFQKNLFTSLKRFFLGYMYSTENLNRLIAKALGPKASFWMLNDSPIDLLITAKRVTDSKQWYFVKDRDINTCRTGILPLLDCVTASASAPTFFQPWTIPEVPSGDTKPVGKLVDGGVGVAGNPVYEACVEAFYYTKNYKQENTTVISLGTGKYIDPNEPNNLLSWVHWLLSELLRSPGEQQTELVQRHFPKASFYRLDPDLKLLDPNLNTRSLDDINQIDRIVKIGEKFAGEIDWKELLEEKDEKFRIGKHNTKWSQYKWPRE